MEVVTTMLEGVLRYIGTVRITDWLDMALMAYLLYRALKLVGSSRAALRPAKAYRQSGGWFSRRAAPT